MVKDSIKRVTVRSLSYGSSFFVGLEVASSLNRAAGKIGNIRSVPNICIQNFLADLADESFTQIRISISNVNRIHDLDDRQKKLLREGNFYIRKTLKGNLKIIFPLTKKDYPKKKTA